MSTTNERLARLEEKVSRLEEELSTIHGKLDDLLALRAKGTGAFWLASAILGTGIVGTFLKITAWVAGPPVN